MKSIQRQRMHIRFEYLALAIVAFGSPRPSAARGPTLYLDPIDGLTTGTHIAPDEITVPVGAVVRVHHTMIPGATIEWSGVNILGQTGVIARAECPVHAPGQETIHAIVTKGTRQWESTCVVNVVQDSLDTLRIEPISVDFVPFDLSNEATNEETMYWFFNQSIADVASVRDLARSGIKDARRLDGGSVGAFAPLRYRTSLDRRLALAAHVAPAAFAPMMEWYLNGEPYLLGDLFQHQFRTTGTHVVDVGPPGKKRSVEIETYKVNVSPPEGGYIPEGEPVTFTAVTDPPGFESDIQWLSSTKYGTAIPAIGRGSSFTVTFQDTFGPRDDGGLWQWIGVKGGNVAIGQDQKPVSLRPCCMDGACLGDLPFDQCNTMGGTWSFEGGECGVPLCSAETPEKRCQYNVRVTRINCDAADCFCLDNATFCGLVACNAPGECPTFPVVLACEDGGTGKCVHSFTPIACPTNCVGNCP